MKMYDERMITFRGRPLFQTAKMVSPQELSNTLEDIACFFYVLKGCGEVVESNGKHRIQKHEGLVKSCGNFISRYMKDEEGNDFEAVIIFLYPDMIREIYSDRLPSFISESGSVSQPKTVIGNQLISKFIDGMFDYFENDEILDEDLAKLKVQELVMILLKSNYYESVVDLFRGLFNGRKNSFREVVQNNLFNDISMEQLAFLTNRSLSTFKREFKAEFQESPARYIKLKRLEAAAGKLIVSDDSISAIAYDCGFQDASTFSDSFRSKYGQAPSQYRLNQMRS